MKNLDKILDDLVPDCPTLAWVFLVANLKRTHDWRETISKPYGEIKFVKMLEDEGLMIFEAVTRLQKNSHLFYENCKKENPCGEVAPFKKGLSSILPIFSAFLRPQMICEISLLLC